jgi:hypothetical protein
MLNEIWPLLRIGGGGPRRGVPAELNDANAGIDAGQQVYRQVE